MEPETVELPPMEKRATPPEGLVVGLMKGDGTIEPYLILDKTGHAEFTGAFGSKQTADFILRNLENYVQRTVLNKLEAHCATGDSSTAAEFSEVADRLENQTSSTSLVVMGSSALSFLGVVLIAFVVMKTR